MRLRSTGVAWLGVRRGVISRVLAGLAVIPAARLASVIGPLGIVPDSAWLATLVAIPAAFVWLTLLGAWASAR